MKSPLLDTWKKLENLPMSEEKAEYVTESTKLLPCPFCGGKADPTGWMADSGGNFISGPECESCGATAQSIEQWNTRPEPEAPESTGGDSYSWQVAGEDEGYCLLENGRECGVYAEDDAPDSLLNKIAAALSTPQQAAPISELPESESSTIVFGGEVEEAPEAERLKEASNER